MMRFFCHLWCIQCHATTFHRFTIALSVTRHLRHFQSITGVHRAHTAAIQPRMSASFPGIHFTSFSVGSLLVPPWNFSSASASTKFPQTDSRSSRACLEHRSFFSSVSARSTDQDRERAILREYGRTYSANKKYTVRRLAEEETEDGLEKETVDDDDLIPEDTFGTLTNKYEKKFNVKDVFDLEEDSDEGEQQTVRPPGRRNTPIWYGNQMKKLIKEGKLMEAVDMLEVRMLKEDRVQPMEINYNVLIGACGREGYTKKAFKLYNQMKKRGLTPSDVTFTSLFNACAESPWPLTDGLTRLRHLHSQLQEKGVAVNQITHHAMIKAYAKCGDLQMAFDLFRDLLSSGTELKSESFAFLLFACASDKERGLTYGIEAWRQMLQRGIKPDIYTYNLLLRIARDCGIGSPEVATRVLLNHPTETQTKKLAASKRKGKDSKGQRSLQPSPQGSQDCSHEELVRVTPRDVRDDSDREIASNVTEPGLELEDTSSKSLVRHQDRLPNLLDLSPDTSQIHSLANASTPADRLALLGGASGILGSMRDHGVTPDVKTMTLLMESLPMSTSDEERLIEAVGEYKVKVDVDFYNAIIRRRSRRANLEGAKAILPLIQKQGLFPNLRTFVNLACECARAKDGIQLLKDMKVAGLKPTVHVYGALVAAAARQRDYRYQIELLKCMEKDNVSPNERILERLEATAAFGLNPNKNTLNKKKIMQQTKLNHFRGFYIKWLDRIGVEETPHPWKKYYRPRGEAAQSQPRE